MTVTNGAEYEVERVDGAAKGCTQDVCSQCEVALLFNDHLHAIVDHVDFGPSAYGFCSQRCMEQAAQTWLRSLVAR